MTFLSFFTYPLVLTVVFLFLLLLPLPLLIVLLLPQLILSPLPKKARQSLF